MSQSKNELSKDFNDIKSEVSTLKSSFNKLIEILKDKIPEVSILIHTLQAKSAEKEPGNNLSEICNLLGEYELKSSELKRYISDYQQRIFKYKKDSNFGEFCLQITKLIEAAIRYYLKRKFRELQNEENEDLLDAYSLIEGDYRERGWNMPDLLQRPCEVRQLRQFSGDEDDDYYLYENSYLSWAKLEKTELIFMFELCFCLLIKSEFYKQKKNFNYSNYYNKFKKAKVITPLATQRQPKNTEIENVSIFLKLEHYYKLNNTREFRNIATHEESEWETKLKELKKKKRYVIVDENNYDGILKSTKWLLISLDDP